MWRVGREAVWEGDGFSLFSGFFSGFWLIVKGFPILRVSGRGTGQDIWECARMVCRFTWLGGFWTIKAFADFPVFCGCDYVGWGMACSDLCIRLGVLEVA